MGILRADLLTHSQLESAGGSVVFDGSGDFLTIPDHSAFHFTGDYTIDFYIKFSTFSGTQRIFGQRNSDASNISVLGEFSSNNFYYYYSQNGTNSENVIIGSHGSSDETKNLELNTWYHVAIVSDGGVHHSYLNGVLTAVNVNNPPPLKNASSTWSIGRQGAFTSNEFSGSIYGFRITQGALYKNNFTVSKFKPKVLPGTVLLCCVSSTSVTEAEVSVGDITSNGDPQIGDTPLLKEDITDTGVVFDGFTVLATSTYMVPPSGKTTERNRGRGLIFGGYSPNPAGHVSTIQSIEIQSFGNAQDFGDLSSVRSQMGAVSSSTRAVSCGGGNDTPSDYTDTNTCEFVTIANTSNTTDFGDLTVSRQPYKGCSNDTRGIIFGGYIHPTNSNTIDFITIATTGNATDFGDEIDTNRAGASCSSTTRGIVAGGFPATNRISFVEIATTGNAQDFGDLLNSVVAPSGCSDKTRGVFAGGATPTAINVIQFITMSSAGDATDFGDLNTTEKVGSKGNSNSIRGIFSGGYDGGTFVNSISAITIATTGNAVDFGDISGTLRYAAGTSDSHGGLS